MLQKVLALDRAGIDFLRIPIPFVGGGAVYIVITVSIGIEIVGVVGAIIAVMALAKAALSC